uniref:Uncharacterized protein n=1 Tax=Cyanothece sp. (strain PCC 7425 / ATCC 29141) TaxID=395961 RepID=B8HZB4_CYAP4
MFLVKTKVLLVDEDFINGTLFSSYLKNMDFKLNR